MSIQPLKPSFFSTTYRSPDMKELIQRHSGLLLSIFFFAVLLLSTSIVNGRAPSYFGISMLVASAATLALAAIGQSVIVIGGGLDLSAGAIVSFSQAVMVVWFADSGLPPLALIMISITTGILAGAINGFFIAVVRLQPIIVTLSTMFTLQGITLLILPQPGGMVPDAYMDLLLDDTIYNVLPSPVTLILAGLAVWGIIRKTSLGTSIFAAGSDYQSADLAGIRVKTGVWASYAIGGGFYGAGGAFVAAQSGAADPLIGAPLMVSSLTAVMLGGTLLGGGKGSATSSVFGALTLISMVSLLLALGVPDYLNSGLEALVLLAAVLINRSAPAGSSSELRRFWLSVSHRSTQQQDRSLPSGKVSFRFPGWRDMVSPEDRRYIIPAWAGLILLVAAAFFYYGDAFNAVRYTDQLLLLGTFLAILVLGQGTVIMSGGFDLSVGACVTMCGVTGAMIMQGSDTALLWTIPAVLATGALIGFINGFTIAVLGLSPIVVTLAMAGILQSLVMFISGGTPSGDAAPLLRWLVNGKIAGFSPLSLSLIFFVFAGILLLKNTTFSRHLISTGTNHKAALTSGVNVRNIKIICYVISGLCAAVAGMLLTGFLGRSSLSLGEHYLLPAVAAVSVGGTLISGGRGHFLGMAGGVLALTALQILLSGTPLPPAVRDIMLGLAVMMAVISLRDK